MIPSMQLARTRPMHSVLALVGGLVAYGIADWLSGGFFPALSFIVGAVVMWLLMRRDTYL
jgi:hypothetical protein